MSATNGNHRGNQPEARRAAQRGGGMLTRRQFLGATGLALGGLAVAGATPLGVRPAAAAAALPYYLGEYPRITTGWTRDIQGLSHDASNWFVSQTTTLWKFPVTFDLGTPVSFSSPPADVRRVQVPPELAALHYNHFGDIDYYGGYVFVPLEYHVPSFGFIAATGIAAFKADDLSYAAYAPLPDQTSAPWCAVDPVTGELYSSNNTLNKGNLQHRYGVDLAKVRQGRAFLTPFTPQPLLDESGNILSLDRVAGGTFGPGGTLYLQAEGIHIFNGRRRAAVSRNTSGTGGFKYEFHNQWPDDRGEEPEGLTYWDLNPGSATVAKYGRAPEISGVLHALLLDNNQTSDDRVYLKHYK